MSQKPSMWMPPETSRGRTTHPAARRKRLSPSRAHSQTQSRKSAPMTAPMRGKKQMAYFIFFSLHSTWGMGRRE